MSPNYNTTKYVWTDFGGVLTPPVSHTMRVFCQKYGLTESQLRAGFEAVAHNHNLTDPLELVDTPLMSEKEWLNEISEQVGGAFQLDTLADDWFRDREPNASWVAYLHEIKAHGVKVGLISNMVPTWDSHWRAMLNEPDLFDDIVLSFEIGYRKPQRGIYEYAAELAGVNPAQCILIDDLARNCEGARAAGWDAIEFTTTEECVKQLHPLLSPAEETV